MTKTEALRTQMLIDLARPFRIPAEVLVASVKRPFLEEAGIILIAKELALRDVANTNRAARALAAASDSFSWL